MKFHLPITVITLLWILDFAAHLVLLVVLLGRDRMRRFPWFSAMVAYTVLQLLVSQLMMGRIPPAMAQKLMMSMADLTAFFNLMVALEVARRAFGRVHRGKWLAGALVAMAVGAAVLYVWGSWPTLQMLQHSSPNAVLYFIGQKGMLLANVEWAFVGLVVILLGGRAGAGFRSHAQRIAIGMMTAAAAQMSIELLWEHIKASAITQPPEAQYRAVHLFEKMTNADRVIYLLVLVWWIVCLWKDEPGAARRDEETAQIDEAGLHGRALPQGPENDSPTGA